MSLRSQEIPTFINNHPSRKITSDGCLGTGTLFAVAVDEKCPETTPTYNMPPVGTIAKKSLLERIAYLTKDCPPISTSSVITDPNHMLECNPEEKEVVQANTSPEPIEPVTPTPGSLYEELKGKFPNIPHLLSPCCYGDSLDLGKFIHACYKNSAIDPDKNSLDSIMVNTNRLLPNKDIIFQISGAINNAVIYLISRQPFAPKSKKPNGIPNALPIEKLGVLDIDRDPTNMLALIEDPNNQLVKISLELDPNNPVIEYPTYLEPVASRQYSLNRGY